MRSEMTPTIASTLAALSNVGKTSVIVRLTGMVYPPPVMDGAAARHSSLISLDADGSLTIHGGVDAWRALQNFSQEVLEAAMQSE